MKSSEETAGDDEPHDFVSSLKNAMYAQVANDFFDSVFREIAIPAMELERFVRDLKADVGRESLRHRDKARSLWVSRIEPSCGLVKERARRFELCRHIGEAELQGLELINAFAEGFTLRHIGKSAIEGVLGAAD